MQVFYLLKESHAQGLTKPYSFRYQQLKQLALFLEQEKQGLYDALQKDLGKSTKESHISEILPLQIELKHTLKNLKSWMALKKVPTPLLQWPAKSWFTYEPKGVVLIISPWNYPLQLPISSLIAAIASGNCALLKPSEHAPNTGLYLQENLPRYVDSRTYTVCLGGVPEVHNLLKLPFQHIVFTGSTRVGRIILQEASKTLIPVTLELGGKSPVIVDKNCDLDWACKRIAFGKSLNGGQTCIAPDYILVENSIQNTFIDLLEKYIKRDLTLILNPSLESTLMQEEIFGPFLPIIPYSNFSEILHVINKLPKPLVIYAFSQDEKFLNALKNNTKSGAFCINDVVVYIANPNLPFGGIEQSGMGCMRGFFGFETLSYKRAYFKNRPSVLDYFFPYLP